MIARDQLKLLSGLSSGTARDHVLAVRSQTPSITIIEEFTAEIQRAELVANVSLPAFTVKLEMPEYRT